MLWFPPEKWQLCSNKRFSGEKAMFVMADDSWSIGKVHQRPQRSCVESPVHRAL